MPTFAKAQTDTSRSKKDTIDKFSSVDVPPSFKGGFGQMISFIEGRMKYPKAAKEAKLKGRVIVIFVVERDGSLTNLKIAKSLSPETDAEALRLVASFPSWSPGLKNSQPVPVQFSIPII